MSDPATPLSRRVLAGRVIAGIWAVNFLLLVTEVVTFKYQSPLSFVLAITAAVLLFERR